MGTNPTNIKKYIYSLSLQVNERKQIEHYFDMSSFHVHNNMMLLYDQFGIIEH